MRKAIIPNVAPNYVFISGKQHKFQVFNESAMNLRITLRYIVVFETKDRDNNSLNIFALSNNNFAFVRR